MKPRRFPYAVTLVAALFFTLLPPAPGRASTITLSDGTTFEGELIHVYAGHYHFILPTGDPLELRQDEIKRIDLTPSKSSVDAATAEPSPSTKKGKPDPAFATPKNVFEHWRHALLRGDFVTMASCFSAAAEPGVLEQLQRFSPEQKKKMINDAKKTRFKYGKAKIKENRATMKVTRRYRGREKSETYTFVYEGNRWKILPN